MADVKKKRKKSPKRLIIPLYFLILIVLIIIVYGFPKISGALTETMTVKYGDMQTSEKLVCYIVKNEIVYYADKNGVIAYNYGDNVQVRAGSEIIAYTSGNAASDNTGAEYNRRINSILAGNSFLSSDKKSITSLSQNLNDQLAECGDETESTRLNYYISELNTLNSSKAASDTNTSETKSDSNVPTGEFGISDTYKIAKSGIISYQLDGYETELNPYTMSLLDEKKLSSIEDSSINFCTGIAVKGEPLFKLVDKNEWFVVAWIDENDLGKYKEDASVTIKLPDSDVKGSIYRIIDNGSRIALIMKFNTYYDSLATLRTITTDVISSDYSGLIIDNEFITSKDGKAGVYLVELTGKKKFVPVKIKTTDGKSSLVAAGTYYETDESGETKPVTTIEVYDEIEKPK